MSTKNNAELILPIILEKLPIPIKYIEDLDVSICGNLYFIILKVVKYVPNEKYLSKDSAFYNATCYRDYSIVKYLIPNHLLFICKSIMKCGYKVISKDVLFDCFKFWNTLTPILNNEKTQAARESSLGLFLLLIVNMHNLIFVISAFFFTSFYLFIYVMIW